jgi:hypothetical protein
MNRSLHLYLISHIALIILSLVIKFKVVGLVGVLGVDGSRRTGLGLVIHPIGRFEQIRVIMLLVHFIRAPLVPLE